MTLQENYKMHEQIGYDAGHKDGEFEKFLEEYNKKGA